LINILKGNKNKETVDILQNIIIKQEWKTDLNQLVNQNFNNNMKFLLDEFSILKNLPINSKFKSKAKPNSPTNIDDKKGELLGIEEFKVIPQTVQSNSNTISSDKEEKNQIEFKTLELSSNVDKEENNNNESKNEEKV